VPAEKIKLGGNLTKQKFAQYFETRSTTWKWKNNRQTDRQKITQYK